jgi:hypothetical protein
LGEGRIMISPDAEEHLFHSYVAKHEFDFMGKRLAEWSNLNLLDMIPKVTGAITLRPAHFDKVERYLYYMPGVSYSQVFFWISFPPPGFRRRTIPWNGRREPIFCP